MTDRERLEKAINDMETTSVCLDVFDRAITTAKGEVWEEFELYLNSRGALWSQLGKDAKVEACQDIFDWLKQQKEQL